MILGGAPNSFERPVFAIIPAPPVLFLASKERPLSLLQLATKELYEYTNIGKKRKENRR